MKTRYEASVMRIAGQAPMIFPSSPAVTQNNVFVFSQSTGL